MAAEGEAVPVTDSACSPSSPKPGPRSGTANWKFQVRDGRFERPESGTAHVFEVRPAKVLTFAKGRFGQTRHGFA